MSRIDPPARLRTPAKPPPPLRTARPSRIRLLWRRRRRLVWPVLAGVALLVLVVVGASIVHGLRPSASVASLPERLGIANGLRVEDVRIEGIEKTPENFLRAALGVAKGDKLLGFSLEAARQRIEKLTWVQSATIERRLSGVVLVRIDERKPFAVWQNNGKFQLIDRNGNPVETPDPAKDADAFKTLPLVVGEGAQKAAADLLTALDTMPALRARVVAAVRVGERRWNLHMNNGADVLLPEGAEKPALDRLMELQASQSLLDRPLQTVDLRLPDRLVVRAAGASATPPPPGKKPS